MPDDPSTPGPGPSTASSDELGALRAEVARLQALLARTTTATNSLPPQGRDVASQLGMAVDLGGIMLWRHDLDTDRVHYNQQGFALLEIEPCGAGLPPAEVRSLIHPDDLPLVIASASRALESAEPVDLELRLRRRAGGWRHLLSRRAVQRDASGRPAAFLGVALDISDRVEQTSRNEALRRHFDLVSRSALDRAALAARGAGVGTWQVDLATGATHWDEQMWSLRGLPPQASVLSEAERLALVLPEDRDRTRDAMHQAQEAGTTLHLEFRVVWPDGQVRWLASRSSQVMCADTGNAQRIGVNWDITDSRTAATARQEAEIALRESQAQSRLLARMSHELRTPLNAMLGFTQLMLDENNQAPLTPANATRHHRLVHVAAAGAQLLALIDDVLDLSSLQVGELHVNLQTLALLPLVESTLPLLGPALAAQPVKVHLGPLAHAVRADARLLGQVLLNLLSNAIKYNRPGGEVRVESRLEASHVLLSVSDTGCGLSEEQQMHLFEPFNRLVAERDGIEGKGIGLAIAKSLVERMGGSIVVQSTAGTGSVFELKLMAADPNTNPNTAETTERADPTADVNPGAPVPPRRYQVLYIEDNPVNALIITELLARREDLTLQIAEDAASGVAAAQAMKPDLILLDMQLPDADGFEVMRRLRARPDTAGITCVALSANAMPDDIERARQAGVADYWTKPLDFKAFLEALDAHLGGTAA